jgi:hypothetical protein
LTKYFNSLSERIVVDSEDDSVMVSCLEKINAVVTNKIDDTMFLSEAPRPCAA